MDTTTFPYKILHEQERGGCSIIYRLQGATPGEDSGKQFVLKVLTPMDDDEQTVHKRFRMEYDFLKRFRHPNLVEVREYYPDWRGNPAYVMEWIDGVTWNNYWSGKDVFSDLPGFFAIMEQLCSVLDFIHKHRIVHRDLKPPNILISKNGDLKLIDFGIMKVEQLTLYTHRNTFLGSAYYIAPECISGSEVYPSADLFSLGVILYDLFTGVKPFTGHTIEETIFQRLVKTPEPPSAIREMPEAMDAFMARILDREPNQRFQSATEVMTSLRLILADYKHDSILDLLSPVDVCTKEPLFHAHFIEGCEEILHEQNTLLLIGEGGSGKTTIVQNLCAGLKGRNLVYLDCSPRSTEMDFMEVILKSVHIPDKARTELKPWMDMLGSALPQLGWRREADAYGHLPLHSSSVLSAFRNVLGGVEKPLLIVVEELHEASKSMLAFINYMARFFRARPSRRLQMILSSRREIPELKSVGEPLPVAFPDLVSLSEYLSIQFNGSQIPLNLTESLLVRSGENIGEFLKIAQEHRRHKHLAIVDGVLTFRDIDPPDTHTRGMGETTEKLRRFLPEQIRFLEWIALCPDGLNLNVLKSLCGAEMSHVSETIVLADQLGVLDFQSSAVDGFRWRDAEVRGRILDGLDDDEKRTRFRLLAKTIEVESKPFLAYSPPLWLILSNLHRNAGQDFEASEYAVSYARYCAQNGNYEMIRGHLSQFSPLPHLQDNLEFWCLLALAYKDESSDQALSYAMRALEIKESCITCALTAVLAYEVYDVKMVNTYLEKVFGYAVEQDLPIQYISLIIPILLDLGRGQRATRLLEILGGKLKGREDLFAANTLSLARMHLVQAVPKRLLGALSAVDHDLLPQTKAELDEMAFLAHIENFDYHAAAKIIEEEDEGREHSRIFLYRLFLNLNFSKMAEVKKIVANFKQQRRSDASLSRLEPIFQLVTELLVNDPNVFNLDHVNDCLSVLHSDRALWLMLLVNQVNPAKLSIGFAEYVLNSLNEAAPVWARHQIPRLKVLLAWQRGVKPEVLTGLLEKSVQNAVSLDLEMEKLRLYILQASLQKADMLKTITQIPIAGEIFQSYEAILMMNAFQNG